MSFEPARRCRDCWGDRPPIHGLIVALSTPQRAGAVAHRIADKTTEEVTTVCGDKVPRLAPEVLWYA